MTDPKIPPVCAEGCAWMPCDLARRNTVHEPGSETAVALRISGVWSHKTRAGYVATEGAARLMRRLGPDEDRRNVPGAVFLGHGGWENGFWSDGPEDLCVRNTNAAFGDSHGWYAPVRFAGQVPDFGETGPRFVDEDEEPGIWVWEDHEIDGELRHVRVTEITLPPLPKAEVDADAAPRNGLWSDDVLRAEIERLQARLREAEEARHEADAKVVRLLGELRAEVQAHDKTRAERDLWRTRAEVARAQADSEIEGLRKERDEARAELERVRETARSALDKKMVRKTPLHLRGQRFAVALRRIADGEV